MSRITGEKVRTFKVITNRVEDYDGNVLVAAGGQGWQLEKKNAEQCCGRIQN